MQNPKTTLGGYAIVFGGLLLAGGYFLAGCDAASVAAGTCEAVSALPAGVAKFVESVGWLSAFLGAAVGTIGAKDGGH